jgi:predicted metal-dependent HD superfamily phosphohydrolase
MPALPGSDPATLSAARVRFLHCLRDLSVSEPAATAVLAGLEDRYAEGHRAYHNLAHVAAMTELAVAERDRLTNWPAVILAIWYHDAVYRRLRSDNEEASAALADRELGDLGLTGEITVLVRSLILATKTHEIAPDVPDGDLFLDLDLAILGAPPDTYEAYRNAIRREYRWVPGAAYRKARAQVLERFLARERIYRTDGFHRRLESAARWNLRKELTEL